MCKTSGTEVTRLLTSKPDPRLRVIESFSMPGSSEKDNEDCIGFNRNCAFVLDGATTLGERQLVPEYNSDAAWLSNFAKEMLEEMVTANSDLSELSGEIIEQIRETYFSIADPNSTPRYAWPSASMAIIHLGSEDITFCGLGDCTLVLEDKNGQLSVHSPLSGFADWEAKRAGKHLERLGGMKRATILNDKTTLDDMRQVRALQNTSESNVWTLGVVPEAAKHLHCETLEIELPAHGVLCSDGFYALVDSYNAYSDRSLLNAIASEGLGKLHLQLREIETKIDPDATLYPRFKQSDDSSAVHFEIF